MSKTISIKNINNIKYAFNINIIKIILACILSIYSNFQYI
jgi:hypothetical protein